MCVNIHVNVHLCVYLSKGEAMPNGRSPNIQKTREEKSSKTWGHFLQLFLSLFHGMKKKVDRITPVQEEQNISSKKNISLMQN